MEVVKTEPVVLISHFDRWMRWALMTLLVIAISLMVLVVTQIDALLDLSNENRAVQCRALVLEGVELDPSGSCYDPGVLRHYDPGTGKSR